MISLEEAFTNSCHCYWLFDTNIRHFVNRHSDFTNSCAHAGAHYLIIIFNFLCILLIEMKLLLLHLGGGNFHNTLNSQPQQIDSLSSWLSLELSSVGGLVSDLNRMLSVQPGMAEH